MSQSKSSKARADAARETDSGTSYSRWIMLALSVVSLLLLLIVYLMPLAPGAGGKGKASLMGMTPWMSVMTQSRRSAMGVSFEEYTANKGETIEEYAGVGALNMCTWSNEADGGWELCEKGMEALARALSRRQVTGGSGSTVEEEGEDGSSTIMDTVKNNSRSAMHLVIIPIIYLTLHTSLLIVICFTKYRVHRADLPVRHLVRTNPNEPTPRDTARGIPGSAAKRFKAYRCVKGPIGKTLCILGAVALVVVFGVTLALSGEKEQTEREKRRDLAPQKTAPGIGAWMVLVAFLCFIPMFLMLWTMDLAAPLKRGEEASKSKA